MQEEVLGRMGTGIGEISTLMLWRETFNLLSIDDGQWGSGVLCTETILRTHNWPTGTCSHSNYCS